MHDNLVLEYEVLDLIKEDHMNNAEIKCHKIHNGIVPWYPTYNKVQLELEYWRMRCKYKLGMHRNVR